MVRLLFVIAVTLVVGAVAFHETIEEPWFRSFYRSVVTVTLTGLDSVPASQRARIVLVVVGITIIAYAGAVIVEAVAGGVVTGAPAERRRERAIHQLRDHFITCGHGRVGRRVAEEFRAAVTAFLDAAGSASGTGPARSSSHGGSRTAAATRHRNATLRSRSATC